MKMKVTTIVLALTALVFNVQADSSTLPAPMPQFMNKEQLVKWNAEQAATYKPVATEEEPPLMFFTGKPYIPDAGGYVYKYRTYNPEMSRWTTADPSGFPDGANNRIYAPVPTSSLDAFGLLTTQPVTQTGNYALSSGLNYPSDWSNESISFQNMLNSVDAGQFSANMTANYNNGTWTPGTVNLTSRNPGGNVNFTLDAAGVSGQDSGTYTEYNLKITLGTPVQTGSTPYIPAPAGGGTATMATVTYKVSVTANFNESATALNSSDKPTADPQNSLTALTFTLTE